MADSKDGARGFAKPALVASDQAPSGLDPSGFDPARLDMLAHRHMRVLERLEPGRRYTFSQIPPHEREGLFRDKLARFVTSDVRRTLFELTEAGIAAKGSVLNCPFCGSHDTRADSEFAGDERVFCGLCGATGPTSPDRAHAIYMWNAALRDRDGGSAGDGEAGSTAKQRQPGPCEDTASPNITST